MGKQNSEAPRRKTKSDINSLRKNVDEPLPEAVADVMYFFDEEESRLTAANEKLQLRMELVDDHEKDAIQGQINKNTIRLNDLLNFKKLLMQHAERPEVQAVSQAMNQVYSEMFGEPIPSEMEKKSLLDRAKEMLFKKERLEGLHGQYVEKNDALDDTLDASQTNALVDHVLRGHPNAVLEAYTTSLDRYRELADKILYLPKKERDRNIDVLLTTLKFYKTFSNGEYHKRVADEMGKAAENILKNQQERFTGLRGAIQKGMEKGTDFAVDHVAGLFSDEDSLARNIFIVAAKMGKDLAKPVVYDAALIEKLKQETVKQLTDIADSVDTEKVEKLWHACIEVKANPDHLLDEDAAQPFRAAFSDFLPVSTALIQKTLETHEEILRDAYILSHGENSEFFEADSTLRAKFISYEGRDVIRLLRVYSPFGIFLPVEVETKQGEPLYLRSGYHQKWFLEHPVLTTALQGAEFAALLGATYGLARLEAQRHLVTRFLGRLLGKPIKKILGPVAAVLLGIESAEGYRDIHVSNTEKEIFEILNTYDFFEEISEEDRREVRSLILRNEIEKRRGHFQGIGYDLEDFGLSFSDRLYLGNAGPQIDGIRDTMKETGEFREALLEANRKLALLGFETYELIE